MRSGKAGLARLSDGGRRKVKKRGWTIYKFQGNSFSTNNSLTYDLGYPLIRVLRVLSLVNLLCSAVDL